MASPEPVPGLEIRHKTQQSHDSGAYIDWNSEDSGGSPVPSKSNVSGEFVTVVAVEGGSDPPPEPESTDPFVTVLSIGSEDSRTLSLTVGAELAEEVLVYRLPGERLGFGLKFEGGTKNAEKVRRLFIQSCAEDSPASRARCSWGALEEGDEVLEIDGIPVRDMTRIDCVRCLKESHVVIKLFVRHPAPNTNPYATEQADNRKKLGLIINDSSSHSVVLESGDMLSPTKSPTDAPMVISAEMKKTPPPPPPIPPRKVPRKNPPRTRIAPPTSIVVPPRGFADGDSTESPVAAARTSLPEEPARFASPPEPEVYLDLLAQEERDRLYGESESDDTGSSISTIVDRLSTSNSSFSTPSTPTPTIDLAKVLSPFEQLEREFSSDDIFTKFSASQDTAFSEYHNGIGADHANTLTSSKSSQADEESLPLQPPISFQDAPLSYGDEKVMSTLDNEDVESDLDSVSISNGMLRNETLHDISIDNFFSEFSEDRDGEMFDIPLTDDLEDDAEMHNEYLDSTEQDESFNIYVNKLSLSSSRTEQLMQNNSRIRGRVRDTNILTMEVFEAPALPPKPAPRQDAPNGGTRFKSGKKRPPPPPPPRNDRPQCPQPGHIMVGESEISATGKEDNRLPLEKSAKTVSQTPVNINTERAEENTPVSQAVVDNKSEKYIQEENNQFVSEIIVGDEPETYPSAKDVLEEQIDERCESVKEPTSSGNDMPQPSVESIPEGSRKDIADNNLDDKLERGEQPKETVLDISNKAFKHPEESVKETLNKHVDDRQNYQLLENSANTVLNTHLHNSRETTLQTVVSCEDIIEKAIDSKLQESEERNDNANGEIDKLLGDDPDIRPRPMEISVNLSNEREEFKSCEEDAQPEHICKDLVIEQVDIIHTLERTKDETSAAEVSGESLDTTKPLPEPEGVKSEKKLLTECAEVSVINVLEGIQDSSTKFIEAESTNTADPIFTDAKQDSDEDTDSDEFSTPPEPGDMFCTPEAESPPTEDSPLRRLELLESGQAFSISHAFDPELNLDHVVFPGPVTTLRLPESGPGGFLFPGAEDDDSEEDDVPEFAVSAVMASEAFFPFHWGVSSHLDTIGEEEEAPTDSHSSEVICDDVTETANCVPPCPNSAGVVLQLTEAPPDGAKGAAWTEPEAVDCVPQQQPVVGEDMTEAGSAICAERPTLELLEEDGSAPATRRVEHVEEVCEKTPEHQEMADECAGDSDTSGITPGEHTEQVEGKNCDTVAVEETDALVNRPAESSQKVLKHQVMAVDDSDALLVKGADSAGEIVKHLEKIVEDCVTPGNRLAEDAQDVAKTQKITTKDVEASTNIESVPVQETVLQVNNEESEELLEEQCIASVTSRANPVLKKVESNISQEMVGDEVDTLGSRRSEAPKKLATPEESRVVAEEDALASDSSGAASLKESAPRSEQQEHNKEFSPEVKPAVKHERPGPAAPSATLDVRPPPAEAAPAPSSSPQDTGVRRAMDALLALDSLTAVISSKPSTPPHGYSHSSLSDTSLSPPPSFSRLPPDGHEFPPNYQEPSHFSVGVPALIEMDMTLEKSEPPPPLPSCGPPQRKTSLGQEVELAPPPVRKFSTSSTASSVEDVTLRSPVRNLPWRKDEKSERSVRDKIAMFSTSQDGHTSQAASQPRRLSKYNSSEDVFHQEDVVDNSSGSLPSSKLISRSVLPVDKVDLQNSFTRIPNDPPALSAPTLYKKTAPAYSSNCDISISSVENTPAPPRCLEYSTRTHSYMDLPSSSSSAYSSCSPDSSLSSTASTYNVGYSSTLPRKLNNNRQSAPPTTATLNENSQKQNGAPTLYRRTSFCGTLGSNLHSRSQSLIDVGALPTNKRNSIAGYNVDDMRKASLNALIEQRRRGISKLRGLVIPEKVTEVTITNQAIIDLPEIKSRDSILTSIPQYSKDESRSPSNRHSIGVTNRWGQISGSLGDRNLLNSNSSASTNLSSLPWKSQAPVGNLPKYSPAFKRKSISVYGVSSSTSSVSSSLSSSREELRPIFDNTSNGNIQKVSYAPPLPPMKPPRNPTSMANNSVSKSVHTPSYTSTITSPLLSPQEPPKSLESITSPTRSDLSFDYLSSNGSSPDLRMTTPTHVKEDLVLTSAIKNGNGNILNGELYMKNSKGTTIHSVKGVLSSDIGEDDSDNDSAVSSSRSSISHGFSPPPSPLPDNVQHREEHHHSNQQHLMLSPLPSSGSVPDKRPLRRTLSSETTASVASSTASTLTSGSQASCSSNGSSGSDSNRRVLKAQSVEAINRKNVLSSARYSSGRDLKVGSPLIQRKFEDGTDERIEGEILEARVESSSHQISDGYDPSEVKSSKETVHHTELSNNNVSELNRPTDTIHFRTSSDNVHDGVIKMAYLEVEETDNAELVPDDFDSYSSSQKGDAVSGDFAGTEDELEEELDCPPPQPVAPLPAPRRTIPPLQSTKASVSTDDSKNESQWTELEKFSSPSSSPEKIKEDDEVFRYEKDSMKNEEKSERNSDRNHSAKFNVETQNTAEFVEVHPSKWQMDQTASSNVNNKPSQAPSVPPKPKPVQRKSSLRNGSAQVEPCNDVTVNNSHEDNNLMDILNGKSTSNDHSPVRLRDRQKNKDAELLNRPVSLLVENNPDVDAASFNDSIKTSNTGEQPISPTSTGPNSRVPPMMTSRHITNRRSVSVNDIKKAFEKAELALASSGRANNSSGVKITTNGISNHHIRVSSLDSTTSEDSCAPPLTHYGSASNLHREQYGSITSLASSSTSLISQQELQSLIDEANQSIEESGGFCTPVHEVEVVILHREAIGGSVGITLAGGADYEAKEITVHKVLAGSLADRDGRIQKGDRILSINGRSMKGVTHKESLNILKAPRLEVVLVMSRSRADSGAADEVLVSNVRSSLSSGRPPRILEQLTETGADCLTEESGDSVARGPPMNITLAKDGAGLGFSLEGGKDSPTGDKPLTIKKIFTGGSAEKNGQLKAGDELLVVNGRDVTVMSRIEAWGLMKKLADGNVMLTVRHKC